jgi:hypothetical protein
MGGRVKADQRLIELVHIGRVERDQTIEQQAVAGWLKV